MSLACGSSEPRQAAARIKAALHSCLSGETYGVALGLCRSLPRLGTRLAGCGSPRKAALAGGRAYHRGLWARAASAAA